MTVPELTYSPNPIPWNIPTGPGGKQRSPGSAHVNLVVTATDPATGARLAGTVVTFEPSAPADVDDPNNFNFALGAPQQVTIVQATTHEVLPKGGTRVLWTAPLVRVSCCGFDDISLKLA